MIRRLKALGNFYDGFTMSARLTDKKLFAALDGNKTKLTLHEIFYRLTEPSKYDSTIKGFGKFLRRLYDACAVNH